MREFRDEYILSSASSVPEGVAFDPRTRRFFATGLFSGSITQVDAASGAERPFFEPTGQPLQLSGAKVDPTNRRLWVCASDIGRMWGGVLVFDVDSGEQIGTYELSRRGICNDVAVDHEGVAYVTDSFQPVIYRVDLRDGSSAEFIRDVQLAAPDGRMGLNGIAISPDGEHIIGGFTSPSKLFVSPRTGGEVHEIALSGDPFAPADDPHFIGADGIVFVDDRLYVIHDGGVQEVTFTSPGYRAGTVKARRVPEPGLSTATVADGELYVVKSEVFRSLYLRQPPRLPFKIYRVPRDVFY